MKPKITRNIHILRIGGCARTERIGTPPFSSTFPTPQTLQCMVESLQ